MTLRPIQILRSLAVASWLILSISCAHQASESCGDGSVCPPGFQCVDTAHTTASDQICAAGTCGNGRLDPGEACDDGNNRSGDGCPADCTQPCGDGVLDPGEVCDDGNQLDLDSCAADCKSRSGVFLITPSVIAFSAVEGGVLPDPIAVTVQLARAGDALQVDYAQDVPAASWLAITRQPAADGTTAVTLAVTDAAERGTRSTSLRLTITHADASIETFDLPVTYVVAPSDLGVQPTPMSLALTAISGDPVPSATVSVTFNGDALTLVSAPVWLTVTGPSPTVTSPATFTIAALTTLIAGGTTLSGDVAFTTTRGTVQRAAAVHVDYTIRAPLTIAITAAPAALAFAAYTGGALPAAQPLAVTFSGDAVTLISAPAWLTVTPPADPRVSPATFTVAANTTAFAAGSTQADDLVFRTTHDRDQQDVHVHVAYPVFARPELDFVVPYVGGAGHPGSLAVNGRGFQPGLPIVVAIGAIQISAIPTTAFQLTLAYPALGAGHYPVTLVEPAVPAPTLAPELVIVAPPTFGYQALDAAGDQQRIIYDPERQRLYVASLSTEIERFAFANGKWSPLPAISVPELTDIALTPNGRSLLVIDGNDISAMALTGSTTSLSSLAQTQDSFCSLLQNAAMAGNGKLLVTSSFAGSGSCPVFTYDLRDHTLEAGPLFFYGVVAGSSDGNHVYLHSGQVDEEPVTIYDTATDSQAFSPGNFPDGFNWVLDRDASRLILNHAQVYDRSFNLTGNLPNTLTYVAAVSNDGSRAFLYAQDTANGGPRLEIYDLNGPLQAGALYPRLSTVLLPDAAGSPVAVPVAMTVSPDDATVFIIGDRKLLVVPVREP